MTDLPTTTATDGLDGAYTPLEPHVVAAATAYVCGRLGDGAADVLVMLGLEAA